MKRILKYFFVAFFCSVILYACEQGAGSKRNLLIITDIGTDVDDMEALCLAAKSDVNLIGIACTPNHSKKMVREASHVMDLLNRDVPVGTGKVFIDSVITSAKGSVKVLLIAPATDLVAAIEDDYSVAEKIDSIFFQGQVFVNSEGNLIIPNLEAYNVSQDYRSAQKLFGFQHKIPFTIVGKYAAYSIPIKKSTFEKYAKNGDPAGIYLRDAAVNGINNFAHERPQVFRSIYNVPADMPVDSALAVMKYISNPYDAAVLISMLRPDLFIPTKVGIHSLIGTEKGNIGIKDSDAIDRLLFDLF